jgi:hypothetical protein
MIKHIIVVHVLYMIFYMVCRVRSRELHLEPLGIKFGLARFAYAYTSFDDPVIH